MSWNALLVAVVSALLGAILGGIVKYWGDERARNASVFAAARTLRRDLLRVKDQLDDAHKHQDWRWLVNLELPSWTAETRSALALYFVDDGEHRPSHDPKAPRSAEQKWDAVESAVFQISLLADEKAKLLAPFIDAEISGKEETLTAFQKVALLAKLGQYQGPLDKASETVSRAISDSKTAIGVLDLPTIPAVFGVTQTWIRRALAIAAAVLLVLAGAIVAFQVLRPSNAPMATRVADSLKGGLKSTSDFAACAPAAAGSPRYLCDVQFKGSTCPPQGTLLRTSLLLPMKTPRASMISELAFADSSDTRLNSTPTARTTPAPSAVPAPSETPTVEPGACVLQFIAEVSQSRQEVMFQRASKDASRSTASMNGSSEVPLKSE